jgi:hypothetical protein
MSLRLKVMGRRLRRQHTDCIACHGSDEPLVVSRPLARRGAATSFAVCATLNGVQAAKGRISTCRRKTPTRRVLLPRAPRTNPHWGRRWFWDLINCCGGNFADQLAQPSSESLFAAVVPVSQRLKLVVRTNTNASLQ